MRPTRREFMIATTTAVCVLSLPGGPTLARPGQRVQGSVDPVLFEGDPYTAHVDEHGLGGKSWDAAFEHALRFRSTPSDRDRFVLGLEV